ncbi:MAG: GNAT family N-acetyltransferase [Anaerolineales bacterium]|nr:GNAT family N-acetyltransferase [Anaerolineales bacterium]
MADRFTVRPAISSDIHILAGMDHGFSTNRVWQMSYQDASAEVGITFREVRLPRPMRVMYPRHPEFLIDHWTNKLQILIAEEEQEPLGYLVLVAGPAEASLWISDLAVDLRRRRMGIGSALLDAAIAWGVERGYSRLFLEMQSKNFPAISMARKADFVFSGYSDYHYPEQDIALFFCRSLP